VDAGGLIQVGPQSAGADPGPICYGRGGTDPTITDANLVLGRLTPKKLLAVDNPVTAEGVACTFEERIGRATGMSGIQAAGAVLKLANMKMAGAIRMVPWRAATTRATSPFSPSAAQARCMPRHLPASSGCRACW